MSTSPSGRSVKIDQDERGGWSSDRPRDGAPRQANLTVRCRVLRPTSRLRYSPGSLLVIVSPVPAKAEQFAQKLVEDRSSLLTLDKVRRLLAGRVEEDAVEARAVDLLDTAVAKRLDGNETVVLVVEGLGVEERERHVRKAAELKRPCHLILLEVGREEVDEADRAPLNALRTALDSGGLGAEGFHTALRLGPGTVGEIKRIAFRPPPRDD